MTHFRKAFFFSLILFSSSSCRENLNIHYREEASQQVEERELNTLVFVNRDQTCVLFKDIKKVKCFGAGGPVLGIQESNDMGDDEDLSTVPFVNVGGEVIDLALGGHHVCALLVNNAVRCWGDNQYGQLGLGNVNDIGDDEDPAAAGDVDVGVGVITSIEAGQYHTCVLFDDGGVKCWGQGLYGALGYGNTNNIGDDETPASVGNVPIGAAVRSLHLSSDHSCAILTTNNQLKCWGSDDWGEFGDPGTTWQIIGNDELPSSVPALTFSKNIKTFDTTYEHSCILFEDSTIRCSGYGNSGRLGYGDTSDVFDLPGGSDVIMGANRPIQDIQVGNAHTCALYEDGKVRCWGHRDYLGFGSANSIGDDEDPASSTEISFSEEAKSLVAYYDHICVVLENDEGLCWGSNWNGELGAQTANTGGFVVDVLNAVPMTF